MSARRVTLVSAGDRVLVAVPETLEALVAEARATFSLASDVQVALELEASSGRLTSLNAVRDGDVLRVRTQRAAGTRPDKYSKAEWELRVQLAACYRIMGRFGWAELIYNHTSVRVDEDDGSTSFLLNAFGLRYDEITASSLIKVDLDGNVIDAGDSAYGFNQAGFVIHSAIHAARADVQCAMHNHTEAGTAVSTLACGVLPITQNALIAGRIAYHDFQGTAVDVAERQSLAEDLGGADCLVLRNHGLLVVGRSIPDAFYRMYNLDKACQIQTMALGAAGGDPAKIVTPPADVQRRTTEITSAFNPEGFGVKEFAALVRHEVATDPSFRE